MNVSLIQTVLDSYWAENKKKLNLVNILLGIAWCCCGHFGLHQTIL